MWPVSGMPVKRSRLLLLVERVYVYTLSIYWSSISALQRLLIRSGLLRQLVRSTFSLFGYAEPANRDQSKR